VAIILNSEQESIVEAQIVSGRFHSVDEALDQMFSGLQDKSAKGSVPETQVPPEVFDALSRDGASEHDHYLYGSPKRTSQRRK
jgi:hypothetical protein